MTRPTIAGWPDPASNLGLLRRRGLRGLESDMVSTKNYLKHFIGGETPTMLEGNAKLSLIQEREEEMVTISCAKCRQTAELTLMRREKSTQSADLEFRGIVTCHREGHRWPVTIKTDNILQSTDPDLPVSESFNLSSKVPPALIQDVKDAEEAHFAGVYRASVVMCRRALQLSFQENPFNISDGPYSRMVRDLMKLSGPPLSPGTHGLAVSIGEYGGQGAHDPKPVSEAEARSAIFTTVRVLNELFPP
jgi:hypothetical protein